MTDAGVVDVDWQALREAQPEVGSLAARVAVVAVCIGHVLILASRLVAEAAKAAPDHMMQSSTSAAWPRMRGLFMTLSPSVPAGH